MESENQTISSAPAATKPVGPHPGASAPTATEATGSTSPVSNHRGRWAVAGLLLTITSWIILYYNGYAALGLAALGLASAIAGLRSSTPTGRNAAVTAIVAASVLLLIVGAFITVIRIGLK